MPESVASAPLDATAEDAVLDEAVREAVQSHIAADSDSQTLPPRDESGKFTKAEKAGEKAGETPAADAAAPGSPDAGSEATTEPEAPTLPEGVVLAAPITGRELAAPFTITTVAGDELEAPDVLLHFTASGRQFAEPLDKVVRMAQWGAANLERDQRYQGIERESQQTKGALQQLQTANQQYEAYIGRLFMDQTLYLTESERWASENTPEQVAQRERQRFEEERRTYTMERMQAENDRFIERDIEPAVQTLAAACPYVSQKEITVAIWEATQHLVDETGFIPASKQDAARWAVVNHVLPYVKQEQDRRAQQYGAPKRDADAATVKAKADAEKAKADAQKAKRDLARTAQPVGRGSATQGSGPTRPASASVADLMDDAIAEAVRSTFPAAQVRGVA